MQSAMAKEYRQTDYWDLKEGQELSRKRKKEVPCSRQKQRQGTVHVQDVRETSSPVQERREAQEQGRLSWSRHCNLFSKTLAESSYFPLQWFIPENKLYLIDSFFKKIILFIYLTVLGVSCSTRDLCSQLWHVGSSSLTRDHTQAPCTGSRVLATGPPGEVPRFYLKSNFILLQSHV